MDILHSNTVLVLNKSWQAIGVKTPAEALSMMFSDSATGLHIASKDNMVPLSWNEWNKLPHDQNSIYITTSKNQIKIPKVIILSHYNEVPKRRPRFTARNLWERDKFTCQYTGKKLSFKDGNIDHIIPKSRGGKTSWTNCVISHKDVNFKKADKTPSEAGLRLLTTPKEPLALPTTMFIKNIYGIKEWSYFLYSN
jgi:5-methylcytosine-specific restriction endonuclease McrA